MRKADEGKYVLITGASTGIGNACARYLDQLGFSVFAGIRRESDAGRLSREASKRLTPVFLDVTETESVREACETVRAAVGDSGLYGLINNAGVAVGGPLEYLSLDRFRSQFDVNVIGQIAMVQQFLPLLRTGQGRIVFMGSIAGRVAWPLIGPYCASKFALEAIADVLRLELRNCNVSVSIVEPGNVKTPIWDKSMNEADRLIAALPADGSDRYESFISGMKRAVGNVTRGGTTPAHVARKIARILLISRPGARYLLGWDARLLVFLRWCSQLLLTSRASVCGAG